MKVSKKWLQDFVEIPKDVTPQKLRTLLTTRSFELEGVSEPAQAFTHMVIGTVLKEEVHPNADRLRVCTVDIGEKQPLTIVCGGSNVVAGMKVAVAKSGARVRWHGEGELVELKDTEIRGVVSQGMICAANEIGMATGNEGEREILDVSAVPAAPGTPLASALGLDDVILDVDNKAITNRPDCWGHYGVAREISAIFEKKLKPYSTKKITVKKKEVRLDVKIEVADFCRRWCGIVMKGITVGPSPAWLQARLRAVGTKPINVIVDVTNYVLLELGQPMHAFDLNKLAQPKILVRHARVDESIALLDHTTKALPATAGVIADTRGPIALAGIMGGAESAIDVTTTGIILEAANFEPIAVRKTATALDIRTDSSARFEKNLDPTMPPVAIARAVELIEQIIPGAYVASLFVDVEAAWKKVLHTSPILLDLPYVQSKIGVAIPMARVGTILKALGFGIKKKNKTTLIVTVPSWRATKDIATAEDLIEEVARMYGYDQIPPTLPSMPIAPPARNPEREAIQLTRRVLAYEQAFLETQTYSFISRETMQKLDLDPTEHVAIANPLSSDQSHVRRRLLPNMLYQVSANMHLVDSVRMFEVGKVFIPEKPGEATRQHSGEFLPEQHMRVTGIVSEKGNETPFYAAKEAGLAVLAVLGVPYRLEPYDHMTNWMHPGRVATISIGDEVIGDISELHPAYHKNFGLDYRVGFFSFDLTALVPYMRQKSTYQSLPKFPPVKRDLAIVVHDHVRFDHVQEYLRTADPLVMEVEVFDIFRGKNIGEHQKSLAFHLTFSHPERTLTAQEVEVVYRKITEGLRAQFQAQVRA